MINYTLRGQALGERIAAKVIEAYQAVLVANRKLVTRKTYESLSHDIQVTNERVRVVIRADKSLLWIEVGKRANTKLPVTNSGGQWELVPELKEWADIVLGNYDYYPLARAIAKNPREGVDITGQVIQITQDEIRRIIVDFTRQEITKQVILETRSIFKKVG